jgi:hypothetical protein
MADERLRRTGARGAPRGSREASDVQRERQPNIIALAWGETAGCAREGAGRDLRFKDADTGQWH